MIRRALALALGFLVATAAPALSAVLQAQSAIGTSRCVLTLPYAPTTGNVLIAWFTANTGDPSLLIDTSKWTLITNGGTGVGGPIVAAYHYVTGGDTVTTPQLTTANFGGTACVISEISTVTGTWATDFEQSDAKYNQTGAGTVSTGTVTTSHNNDLAVTVGFSYTGTQYITGFSGFSTTLPMQVGIDHGNYGSYQQAQKIILASGSMFSTSFTVTGGTLSGYITLVMNGSGASSTIQSSKANLYSDLSSGTSASESASKANSYGDLRAGTAASESASKTVAYAVLKTKKGGTGFVHSFPP